MRVDEKVAEAPPSGGTAFAAWAEPLLAPMTWLAARMAPAEREDVVQEALLRAWTKRHTFDPAKGSQRAWALAIVADQARKHQRRLRPVPAELDDAHLTTHAVDGARVDVERALSQLTDRQRLAVDCFYFVDLSVRETAAVMGCSEGTVKSTLSEARARLRPFLETDHV